MKKMRMDIEQLTVESFHTGGYDGGGTVWARSSEQTNCGCQDPSAVCADQYTPDWGCPNSDFPCQSVNACTVPTHTCYTNDPGGPDSCDPRCTLYGTCDRSCNGKTCGQYC